LKEEQKSSVPDNSTSASAQAAASSAAQADPASGQQQAPAMNNFLAGLTGMMQNPMMMGNPATGQPGTAPGMAQMTPEQQ